MTPEPDALLGQYFYGQLDADTLLALYPAEDGATLARSVLDEAIRTQDPGAAEWGYMLAAEFIEAEEARLINQRLLRMPWHHLHEWIVSSFDNARDANAVDDLYWAAGQANPIWRPLGQRVAHALSHIGRGGRCLPDGERVRRAPGRNHEVGLRHLMGDPERDPDGAALGHRSIQIGLSKDALHHYVHRWSVSLHVITDALPAYRPLPQELT